VITINSGVLFLIVLMLCATAVGIAWIFRHGGDR
jgi:hypothetical protein